MTEFIDMLKAAEADLESNVPQTFTVVGGLGPFACLFDVTTVKEVYSVTGMAPEDTARITFSQAVAYGPLSGDVITFQGRNWRVVAVKRGPIEHELELTGVHE